MAVVYGGAVLRCVNNGFYNSFSMVDMHLDSEAWL